MSQKCYLRCFLTMFLRYFLTLSAALLAEWLRSLVFSALNRWSSHRCGFEPSSGHMWDKSSSSCGSLGGFSWWYFSFLHHVQPQNPNTLIFENAFIYEPSHDKTNKMNFASFHGIHPVWSESSLSAWRSIGSFSTHKVHSKDSDQTARICRLICAFVVRIWHK